MEGDSAIGLRVRALVLLLEASFLLVIDHIRQAITNAPIAMVNSPTVRPFLFGYIFEFVRNYI